MPFHTLKGGAAALAPALALVVAAAAPAAAQNVGDVGQDAAGNVYTYTIVDGQARWTPGRVTPGARTRTILAERFVPAVWTDPDGCQHWVMDDGVEGYMTPRVDRHGRPVCN